MVFSCWSAKGGSGTTVVAVALALSLARSAGEALLVDAAGDVPAVLGMAGADAPGLTEWMAAGPRVPADALARLELVAAPGLQVVPRGSGGLARGLDGQARVLAGVLAGADRPVVIDCGLVGPGPAEGPPIGVQLAGLGQRSLLVTRACYLSLQRAARAPVTPTEVVLLIEPGRALDRHDVAQVVGSPVVAEIAVEPAVARAVDAGTLAARVPRQLERALRGVR